MSCLKHLLTKWKQLVLAKRVLPLPFLRRVVLRNASAGALSVTNTRPNEFAIDSCQLLTTCIANPCREREWVLTIVNKLLNWRVLIFYVCNKQRFCSM